MRHPSKPIRSPVDVFSTWTYEVDTMAINGAGNDHPTDTGKRMSCNLDPYPKPVGGETILVVDDEPRLRRVLTRRLTGLGYRVFEAEERRRGHGADRNGPGNLAPVHRRRHAGDDGD